MKHYFPLLLLLLSLGSETFGEPIQTSARVKMSGLWEVIPSRPDAGRGGPGRSGQPGGTVDDNGLSPGDRRVRSLMTKAGQTTFDEFDPSLLPANNCQSPGLPSIAVTPNLQLWAFEGNSLNITHEYFSTERVVHLDQAMPEGLPHSAAGFAAGTIDTNNLTIETSALSATWGGLSRNAPSSDSRIVTERYTVSEDGQTMRGTMEISDNDFLRRNIILSINLRRPAPGTELVTFPCDIDASRRHLDN